MPPPKAISDRAALHVKDLELAKRRATGVLHDRVLLLAARPRPVLTAARGWVCEPAFGQVHRRVINGIKAAVLALFALYWVAVVVILVFARSVFDQVARLTSNQRPAEVGEVLVLTPLFALLSTGIVRGWRWTLWLILVAFQAGILRVPIVVLELAGKTASQGRFGTWYLPQSSG